MEKKPVFSITKKSKFGTIVKVKIRDEIIYKNKTERVIEFQINNRILIFDIKTFKKFVKDLDDLLKKEDKI